MEPSPNSPATFTSSVAAGSGASFLTPMISFSSYEAQEDDLHRLDVLQRTLQLVCPRKVAAEAGQFGIRQALEKIPLPKKSTSTRSSADTDCTGGVERVGLSELCGWCGGAGEQKYGIIFDVDDMALI